MFGGSQGGGSPPKKKWYFLHLFLVVFQRMVFVNGFLILIKELGLLINMGQYIRVFGCRKILYIVL
jgi:hypothetical protein